MSFAEIDMAAELQDDKSIERRCFRFSSQCILTTLILTLISLYCFNFIPQVYSGDTGIFETKHSLGVKINSMEEQLNAGDILIRLVYCGLYDDGVFAVVSVQNKGDEVFSSRIDDIVLTAVDPESSANKVRHYFTFDYSEIAVEPAAEVTLRLKYDVPDIDEIADNGIFTLSVFKNGAVQRQEIIINISRIPYKLEASEN